MNDQTWRIYRRGARLLTATICGALLWEWVGAEGLLGSGLPPLTDVIKELIATENRTRLADATRATAHEAALGLTIGALLAVTWTICAALIPHAKVVVVRLAVIAAAIPIVALGPVLITLVSPAHVPIAIAAIYPTSLILLPTLRGVDEIPDSRHDVFTALGASRLTRLVRLVVPWVAPSFATGLKVAAPWAVLGAIVGEWFSADQGLGALLVASLQNYATERMWSAAVLSTFISLAAYGALGIVSTETQGRLR